MEAGQQKDKGSLWAIIVANQKDPERKNVQESKLYRLELKELGIDEKMQCRGEPKRQTVRLEEQGGRFEQKELREGGLEIAIEKGGAKKGTETDEEI